MSMDQLLTHNTYDHLVKSPDVTPSKLQQPATTMFQLLHLLPSLRCSQHEQPAGYLISSAVRLHLTRLFRCLRCQVLAHHSVFPSPHILFLTGVLILLRFPPHYYTLPNLTENNTFLQ